MSGHLFCRQISRTQKGSVASWLRTWWRKRSRSTGTAEFRWDEDDNAPDSMLYVFSLNDDHDLLNCICNVWWDQSKKGFKWVQERSFNIIVVLSMQGTVKHILRSRLLDKVVSYVDMQVMMYTEKKSISENRHWWGCLLSPENLLSWDKIVFFFCCTVMLKLRGFNFLGHS